VCDRLRERPLAELGHVGLADDHRTCFAQAANGLAVGGGWCAVGPSAERGDGAGDVQLLLDGDRHTVQRTASVLGCGVARGCLGQCIVGEEGCEGVEATVVTLDPLQRRRDQLDGGEVAAAERRGLAGHAGEEDVVVHVADATSAPRSA
jgi:hypothetical protein